ncbi:MAG: hypothetical protein V4672_07860 [Verrucomicrobiota bacterium]
MVTLSEIQSMAFDLPKSDQLRLADHLLNHAEDVEAMFPEDILAEAIRRDQEMQDGLVKALTVDEFWAKVHRVGEPR